MSCPRQAEACSTGEEHGDEPKPTMGSVIPDGLHKDLNRCKLKEWDHESSPFLLPEGNTACSDHNRHEIRG